MDVPKIHTCGFTPTHKLNSYTTSLLFSAKQLFNKTLCFCCSLFCWPVAAENLPIQCVDDLLWSNTSKRWAASATQAGTQTPDPSPKHRWEEQLGRHMASKPSSCHTEFVQEGGALGVFRFRLLNSTITNADFPNVPNKRNKYCLFYRLSFDPGNIWCKHTVFCWTCQICKHNTFACCWGLSHLN